MADNRNTLTDEILVLAETLGDIKARFERVESEFETQSKPLEAALAALSAAMTGIKTLQHHVLDNSLSALSLKVEEQRKAIDEQITVIVGELKGADAQNSEKIALQTAELKQQFSEISANVKQLAAQFEGQLKRVELEAQEKLTKFAAVPGPQGPAGASINPRGNWIDGVTYNRLDVVSLLGTSYISAVDNNTSKPARNGDKWTVLARAGTGGGGAANFGSLAGVAEITQGGTGQTTALAGARALLDGISTTRGTVIYRGSDGWTALTPGAADTVLKSQGTGADPQWAATSNATAATNAQAAAGTSTTTFITPANAEYAAAPVVNGRASRQGLVFNGTTGSTGTLGSIPSGTWTVSAVIDVPTSNPASNIMALTMGIGYGVAGGGSFVLGDINPSGNLTISQWSGAYPAYREANISGFRATYSGKRVHIAAVVTGSALTIYVNGVSTSYTETSGAGAPAWGDTLGSANVFVGKGQSALYYFSGGIYAPLIYNRALSAAEVVALYESGAPSGADYNSATNTNQITGDAWWNTATGSVSSGTLTMTSGQYILRTPFLTKGKRYRTTYNVTALTGTVQVGNTSAATTVVQNVSLGAGSFEFTANDNGAFGFNASAGTATINNVTFVPVGLLLAPDAAQAGNGYVWNDQSGNLAQIVLPSSGVQWNLPSVAGNRIRGTTSTNGNQQLLGASVLLPAECQITHVRARARSGTPTITIGTASGGAQIVASVALSTTWLNCTIALTGGIVSSADDIWVGSNSTDVVETDIAFQPLDF